MANCCAACPQFTSAQGLFGASSLLQTQSYHHNHAVFQPLRDHILFEAAYASFRYGDYRLLAW